jgi:hypothetical protein
MTYRLVMFLASAASGHMLHVGNFTSMQDCMDAAHTTQFAAPVLNSPPQFVCIQANDSKRQPPPG